MTAWILLLALAALFALAVRHGRSAEPRMPSGFDGERQLADFDEAAGKGVAAGVRIVTAADQEHVRLGIEDHAVGGERRRLRQCHLKLAVVATSYEPFGCGTMRI